MLDSISPDWDPEHFDLELVNEELRAARALVGLRQD
jgi:hypothetical protein